MKSIIIRPKFMVIMMTIGFLLLGIWAIVDSLIASDITWITIVAILALPFLIYAGIAFITETIVISDAGLRVTNTFSLGSLSFSAMKASDIKWKDIRRIKAADTLWFVTRTILIQSDNAIIPIGTSKTNFKLALLYILQHVEENVVDEDVLRLAAKYRRKSSYSNYY